MLGSEAGGREKVRRLLEEKRRGLEQRSGGRAGNGYEGHLDLPDLTDSKEIKPVHPEGNQP